jgi:FKBP-type peptidyl-prolyl cis-trans isomerase 2
MRRPLLGLIVGGLAFAGLLLTSHVLADTVMTVGDGMKVTLEYTLTLPDKSVADSNVGKEPFSYQHGAHVIVPGLEKALTGLKAGDRKRVVVPPDEAYGAYDNSHRITVLKANVPSEVKVDSVLQDKAGRAVRVVEITSDSVILDTNHPLAGKELTFDVKIIKVERSTAGEKTR